MRRLPAEVDLRRYVRPGDLVMWGQAEAEPLTLTQRLVEQRAQLGGIRCFVGMSTNGTLRPEHADHLRMLSYTGSGSNRALARAGALHVLPSRYSDLPTLIADGRLPVDVLMLQVPPAGRDGRTTYGLADEYLSAAAATARVVLAEVNDRLPRTSGSSVIRLDDMDAVVYTSRDVGQTPAADLDPVGERVAAHVAGLVDDGSTLQVGIGALPDAILRRLTTRRGLGIHSGQVGDAVAALIEAGAVTNEHKPVDRGTSVTGWLAGSQRLLMLADRNPAISLRPTAYTHDPAVLAALPRLVAVNSAIEVDLTGQVNAEVAAGVYVGAVGGAIDFMRGATRSRGGVPITAIRSCVKGRSTIVARLSGPVTVPRSDVGVVVTEHGVADLRGLTLRQRRAALLELADPSHRDELDAAARDLRPGEA